MTTDLPRWVWKLIRNANFGDGGGGDGGGEGGGEGEGGGGPGGGGETGGGGEGGGGPGGESGPGGDAGPGQDSTGGPAGTDTGGPSGTGTDTGGPGGAPGETGGQTGPGGETGGIGGGGAPGGATGGIGGAPGDAPGPTDAPGPGPDAGFGNFGFGYTDPTSGLSPASFSAPDFNAEFGAFNAPDTPGWAGILGISDPTTGTYVSQANPESPEQAAAQTQAAIESGQAIGLTGPGGLLSESGFDFSNPDSPGAPVAGGGQQFGSPDAPISTDAPAAVFDVGQPGVLGPFDPGLGITLTSQELQDLEAQYGQPTSPPSVIQDAPTPEQVTEAMNQIGTGRNFDPGGIFFDNTPIGSGDFQGGGGGGGDTMPPLSLGPLSTNASSPLAAMGGVQLAGGDVAPEPTDMGGGGGGGGGDGATLPTDRFFDFVSRFFSPDQIASLMQGGGGGGGGAGTGGGTGPGTGGGTGPIDATGPGTGGGAGTGGGTGPGTGGGGGPRTDATGNTVDGAPGATDGVPGNVEGSPPTLPPPFDNFSSLFSDQGFQELLRNPFFARLLGLLPPQPTPDGGIDPGGLLPIGTPPVALPPDISPAPITPGGVEPQTGVRLTNINPLLTGGPDMGGPFGLGS